MSQERDPAREPSDPLHDRAEEPDPTGVRAILSALPDPGPMPLDLVHRITASLEVERARGERETRDGPAPTGHATVSSLSTARERRARGGRIPVIAAAASIVVLAGAVVMGILMTGWGLGMGSSSDSAVEQLAGAAADSGAEAGADADTFGSTESAPQADGTSAPDATDERSSAMSGIAVLATGAVLTGTTLSDHARVLRDDPATLGHDADAEAALTRSMVGTAEGAAGCLGGLLSIPTEEALGLLAGMDVVRFDGAFAAVIIASGPGSTVDPPQPASTAYLVPLDCGPRSAALLHAPVPIPS